MRNSVDFPDPDGPSRQRISPARIVERNIVQGSDITESGADPFDRHPRWSAAGVEPGVEPGVEVVRQSRHGDGVEARRG